jgi:hypothetical protein
MANESYIYFYNYKRIHSVIGYITPAQKMAELKKEKPLKTKTIFLFPLLMDYYKAWVITMDLGWYNLATLTARAFCNAVTIIIFEFLSFDKINRYCFIYQSNKTDFAQGA